MLINCHSLHLFNCVGSMFEHWFRGLTYSNVNFYHFGIGGYTSHIMSENIDELFRFHDIPKLR